MGDGFVVDSLCLSALSSPRTLFSLLSLKSPNPYYHRATKSAISNILHLVKSGAKLVVFSLIFWRLNVELFRSRGQHRWRENIFRLKKLNFNSNFSTFVDWKVKYNFTTPPKESIETICKEREISIPNGVKSELIRLFLR